ncbi:hypothetical protein APHAL10511_004525 [Amanita phalloides]|nr:hypothetical protein APHAL10511_004525 [Amanita phalloides]
MTRRSGQVLSSPNAPSSEDVNFDVWDHLFLVHCFQGLTVRQSDKAPTSILDLGCGSGYWTIEAARRWPNSFVVGYDMLRIQPDLDNSHAYKNIAHRVGWVHGDFFQGLPFLPDHFDFVHISWIGLGVPENEWQSLLEEVSRVMKPGAIIEIIEEDPIFPGFRPPSQSRNSSSSLPSAPLRTALLSGYKSNETLPSRTTKLAYAQKTIDSIAKRFRLGSRRKTIMSDAWQGGRSTDSLSTQAFSIDESNGEPSQLKNHSNLKLAWEALLSNRFLPTNLLSVLPFYLSTSFVKIQSHPQLNIPLPPTSGRTQPRYKINSIDDNRGISRVEWPTKHVVPDSLFHLSALSSSTERECKILKATTPSSNAMHLARTVNTIKGYKAAIWKEYVTLCATSKLHSVGVDVAHSLRDVFELEWKNWLNDMDDRIGMRRCLTLSQSWPEPPGDKTDRKIWREDLDFETNINLDLCRSIRAFVAWKA